MLRISIVTLMLTGCLPAAMNDGNGVPNGTSPPTDNSPAPAPTPASAYFNPDIQADLDKLGCTASACHGAIESPVMVGSPASASDWTSNYARLHSDCSTTSCLSGGSAALLLQKPLVGGAVHGGTKPFTSTADPTYQRWLGWVNAGAPYDGTNDPPDLGMAAPDLGAAGDMASAERMTITFTTQISPSPNYNPKNVVVAWIESNGTFVKTASRWAGQRRTHLVGWVAKAGNADVDAVSSATQPSYGALTAVWDMSARTGLPKPVDGVYTIRLELADSNSSQVAQNNEGTFTFNRNGTASTQANLTNGGFSKVTIQYTGR